MFQISRKKELLQKINNISEERSETDSSQSESEDQLNDSFGSDEFDSDYEDFLFQLGEELAAEYKKSLKRPSVSCKTTSFPSRQKSAESSIAQVIEQRERVCSAKSMRVESAW